MSQAGLRDHAEEILTAIVRDMESLQSAADKSMKSKGRGPHGRLGQPGALGQLHALLRLEGGFTLAQVLAEYRALRASVFRLWTEAPDAAGVLRFNEAIDEALSEAVEQYTKMTNEYRDPIIGVVSHDLRNPLGGILLGSTLLSHTEGLDDKSARIASRIQSSAKRMIRIVGDLLDLTRTRLGAPIPLVRGPVDLGPLCQMVIAELEGSHPNAVIHFTSKGDVAGDWDSDRLAQVVSNLLGNALDHGDVREPVRVDALDEGKEIVLAVHNSGPPIPASALGTIFEPMVRNVDPARARTGLGLGLYIARELVAAHGAAIAVISTKAAGTTFTVRLPRHVPPEKAAPASRKRLPRAKPGVSRKPNKRR